MSEAEDADIKAWAPRDAWTYLASTRRYQLVRFAILRLLGAVYFFSFLATARQWLPLLGERGLLPAKLLVEQRLATYGGDASAALFEHPTIFWFDAQDATFVVCAWVGVGIAGAVMLGWSHVGALVALWVLHVSFSHVGQVFYGYGWEILLGEIGFLAIFFGSLRDSGPWPRRQPSVIAIVLMRWVCCRVMLGAGLIKLRGDECWRDLTCLDFHFETQPLPNPLSAWFHGLPPELHAAGVIANHVAELAAPVCVFGPRPIRLVAGVVIITFQLVLVLSGNLSFLNWLTIVAALACFDDDALGRLLRGRLVDRATNARPARRSTHVVVGAYALIVALLSIAVVDNMASSRQRMNATFERFGLVNSYGAFGGVGRERYEIVIEGTNDPSPYDGATWRAYELPCKPGDVTRVPCITSPYHRRLDWQLWFAAMSKVEREPWLVHLVMQLLSGDEDIATLFENDPFDGQPPRYVRIRRFRYELVTDGWGSWRRTYVDSYLRPVARDDAALHAYLERAGLR